MPRIRSSQQQPTGPLREKSLCIIDTCSLVYMDHVELARKPLQKWLWEEFDIKYSEAVLNELKPFEQKMISDENWEKYVWKFSNISSYEKALFSTHRKKVVAIYCSRCKQTSWKYQMFTPNLTEDKDKGERYNCALALHAILEGHYSQVIFLTDDLRAQRDYTAYFFDVFPIGTVWSLLDLVVYLFIRNRRKITIESVKDALHDINAQSGSLESEKKLQRLASYYDKVDRIASTFSQISGGRL